MADDIQVSFSESQTIEVTFAGASTIPASTAANDFLAGNGTTFIKKTLAETKTILGITGNEVDSTDITNIVQLTQAAYDLLAPPDANTLYLIVG